MLRCDNRNITKRNDRITELGRKIYKCIAFLKFQMKTSISIYNNDESAILAAVVNYKN